MDLCFYELVLGVLPSHKEAAKLSEVSENLFPTGMKGLNSRNWRSFEDYLGQYINYASGYLAASATINIPLSFRAIGCIPSNHDLKIIPIIEVVLGLDKGHHKIPVHNFDLSFNFDAKSTEICRDEKDQITDHVPGDLQLIWYGWLYTSKFDQLLQQSDLWQAIPYNPFIFGLSRYKETESFFGKREFV